MKKKIIIRGKAGGRAYLPAYLFGKSRSCSVGVPPSVSKGGRPWPTVSHPWASKGSGLCFTVLVPSKIGGYDFQPWQQKNVHFFFSSRRRHTRCGRDWSSDVCSSDLKVYINKVEKFMPNEAVSNDEMEEILGKINDTPSKSRRLILRNNGIQKRYYALDRNGKIGRASCREREKIVEVEV